MKEYEYETRAMGTDIAVSIVTNNPAEAQKGCTIAFETIAIYENIFSRFRPKSELSQLNQTRSATVSPQFYEVFCEALMAHSLSSGVFNPLVQVSRLGYSKNFDDLSKTQELYYGDFYDTDVSKISFNKSTNTITLSAGQRLDFGGFLKGYLAEKIAKSLMKMFNSYQGIIINLGGDLHTIGTDSDENIFVFSVFNPITKDEISIPIHNKSLATSGTYKRTWETNQGIKHHILDESGKNNPLSNIISASVTHPSGTKSEVFAKIFITKPLDKAINLINDPHAAYLLITKDGTVIKNI